MLYAGSNVDEAEAVFAEAIYHRPRIRLTFFGRADGAAKAMRARLIARGDDGARGLRLFRRSAGGDQLVGNFLADEIALLLDGARGWAGVTDSGVTDSGIRGTGAPTRASSPCAASCHLRGSAPGSIGARSEAGSKR